MKKILVELFVKDEFLENFDSGETIYILAKDDDEHLKNKPYCGIYLSPANQICIHSSIVEDVNDEYKYFCVCCGEGFDYEPRHNGLICEDCYCSQCDEPYEDCLCEENE